jgi:hypothetical protein
MSQASTRYRFRYRPATCLFREYYANHAAAATAAEQKKSHAEACTAGCGGFHLTLAAPDPASEPGQVAAEARS